MNINKYGKALSWITRPKSTETATLENFNPEEFRTPFRGAGLVDHGSRVGKLTTTVPLKRGPNYQGLNVKYKKVKTISEKINGGNRQVLTQRSKDQYKIT